MSEQRQPGYYWVKYHWNKEPIPSRFVNGFWHEIGCGISYDDGDITEIGSRITPEMKYTEEDMIEFAWYCQKNGNGRLVHEILENWIEQKETE